MKITLYSLPACPRCYLANKHLESLQKDFPEMEINKINALTNFKSAKEQGIRMVPALVGHKKISAIMLSKEKIANFLKEEKEIQNQSNTDNG